GLGIFILDKVKFTAVTLVCGVILCVPKAALLVRKKYESWMKYGVLISTVVAINLAYTVLTFHIVMIFSFPLIISVTYFDRKLTTFTTWFSAVLMTAAHLLSYFTSVVFDDPLKSMKSILIFGLMPRLMIFCLFSIICISLGNKTQHIFDELNNYTVETERRRDSLDTIINVSRPFYSASNMLELSGLIRTAVTSVTANFRDAGCETNSVIGIRDEDGVFHKIDSSFNFEEENLDEGEARVSMKNVSFVFPVKKRKKDSGIQINQNGIGMCFYADGELFFYITMEFPVEDEGGLLKSSLDILYHNISTAIKQTTVNNNIFKTQEAVILSFAEISESKSHQTGQHVKRVSEYTRIMAACAGYSETQCSKIALAAMMHDIGKLMIPPEILEKPGRLTEEEFKVIKTHVTYGEELLKNSPGEVMSMARKIALQHHERWDGNGYLGYKGEEIDYISGFVSVADVFDALVSKRSYKEGWAPRDAFSEIVKNKGTQFAPYAVDIFVKCYDDIYATLMQYPDRS
ncbi:MAG: HD-GYP domain-containing protein, partial [Ruminococcus sp.]|nr:HD-GYP domain-containing protein [Ruminococcus sp.]